MAAQTFCNDSRKTLKSFIAVDIESAIMGISRFSMRPAADPEASIPSTASSSGFITAGTIDKIKGSLQTSNEDRGTQGQPDITGSFPPTGSRPIVMNFLKSVANMI